MAASATSRAFGNRALRPDSLLRLESLRPSRIAARQPGVGAISSAERDPRGVRTAASPDRPGRAAAAQGEEVAAMGRAEGGAAQAQAAAGGEPSDAALLARFAAGEERAAKALVDRHAGRVLAVASRMLNDSAEAEDVAQEAMMRVWRVAAEWEDRGVKFSTWLHRVALNLCYDRLRKRRGVDLDEAPEQVDPTPSVEARMTAAESRSELAEALQTLPERQRQAIILRHYEELSNPEIAEALGVSVEAVESLLSRGRRALKARLAGARAE